MTYSNIWSFTLFRTVPDDSGRWGKGGLFSALSSRSLQPETQYELAGQMKDLGLGDAHLVSIDDLMCREVGKDMVRVCVCVCVCVSCIMQVLVSPSIRWL